jgi:hypothetical protein
MLNILNKVDVTKNVSHKTITKALGISVSTWNMWHSTLFVSNQLSWEKDENNKI